MPIIKSAKKRAKIARVATVRNAKTKRSLKSALKAFTKSPSAKALNEAMSVIDTAAKKNVIHKNKAARLKKQVAASGKNAGIRPSSTAKKTTTAAKKTTSRPAAKKTTAKPAAKKTATTKKPATKKASPKK